MTDTDFDAIAHGEPSAEHDPTNPDPTAPYGRTDNGTLLDSRGRKAPYGLTKSGLRKSGGRKNRGDPSARRLANAKDRRPSGRTITRKRRDGLVDQFGQLQGLCLMFGRAADHDGLLAEAVTIGQSGPGLAAALAEYAEDHDRLGAMIDRLVIVGPGLSLGMAVGAFLAQTARNFGLLPGDVMGTVEPADLADLARQMAEPSDNGAERTSATAA